MPLAADIQPGDGCLDQHKNVLLSFADKISSCIENSEWDKLAFTLESRQAYLQKLFSDAMPESCLDQAVLLAQSVLEQDRFFISELEKKKAIASQMQLSLERGRRATQLYSVVQT